MNDHDLSLKTLIHAVSDELLASREERLASGKPALFEIQELIVEVSFVVTASKGGGGGFDLKVIRADMDLKYDTQSIHKVALKLRALSETDSILTEVGDELPVRPRSPEGYDLRLMSVNTADDLVNEGRNLAIVALVGTNLHIRIFDANGNRVVDKAENELMGGDTLTILKSQLNPLPDESCLSQEQKQKIIQDATSIAGHTPSE